MSKDLLRSTCENFRRLEAEVLMIYFFSLEADGVCFGGVENVTDIDPSDLDTFQLQSLQGKTSPQLFYPKTLIHQLVSCNFIVKLNFTLTKWLQSF